MLKVSDSLFTVYDDVFFAEMATVTTVSPEEVALMHGVITMGEGGHLNQGR
jgi:hypothetical protein